MDRQPVSSSNLASVGYDSGSEILEVEFNNGRVYQYYNVPEFMYERLMEAGSMGNFLNTQIKGAYACSQV
jgi:hypothetical protein